MYLHCSNFSLSLDTATFTKPMDFKVVLLPLHGFAESQNLARHNEIAKISIRKIVAIPKSQNFVLANNSNNKVCIHTYTQLWPLA